MIVITGASDGLGLELAKLYKAANKTVINISRRESEAATTNLLHDLSKADEIIAAANEVTDMTEPLEVIINCAGVYTKQPLGSITEDEIKQTLAVNVEAPILLVSTLIDRIKKDGADIVNVSSVAGTKGIPEEAVYGASKWALRGFSANLQLELKETPSRVISFCPGGFDTKIFEKATGEDKTKDGTIWMPATEVARCIKQLLDLPKSMEVSEIVVNRKKVPQS